MKKEFEIIAINWLPPMHIAYDTYLEAKTINLNKLENSKNCLYQAYGDSMIYGKNKLLYIGKATDFISRLNNHITTDFNRILNLTITIGKFDKDITIEEHLLEMIENILICYVKPSYNSASLKDIHLPSKKTPILILNKGNRGSLPLECSNYWWLHNDK